MTEKELALIEAVKSYAIHKQTYHTGLHGLAHWDRVAENGKRLQAEGVDPLVVQLFAYLHDSCREADGYDLEHGPRAADSLPAIRDTLLRDLTEEQYERLETAIRHHTDTKRTDDPTVNACFDADRLDLTRCGITPKPSKMASPLGAELARAMQEKKQ